MKKRCLNTFIMLLLISAAFGQMKNEPHLQYFGILSDIHGKPYLNQNMGVRCIMYSDVAETHELYSETQQVRTSTKGKVKIHVPEIGWRNVQHLITVAKDTISQKRVLMKIEIDPEGGENYTWIGRGTVPLRDELMEVHQNSEVMDGNEEGLYRMVSQGKGVQIAQWQWEPINGSEKSEVNVSEDLSTDEISLELLNAFRELVYLHRKKQ